jgi:urocanate hydratase
MGVVRHVDAGYERADQVADERGVAIPMHDSHLTEPEDPTLR